VNKLTASILILLISPIIAGIYGIIHDQITYTISEEYYTKFKFIQFGLEDLGLGTNIGSEQAKEIELKNPRLGVSIVGFLATWWVGLIIGAILGLVGFIHRTGREMFEVTMKASVLTIVITLTIGIIGLICAYFILSDHLANREYLPNTEFDQFNFVIVGWMHNSSYLGGLIGLIVSIVYSIRIKKKRKTTFYNT